jgi:RNAse (barnase) inhibitor barstar
MEAMAKQLMDAQESGVYQLVRSPEEVERAATDAGLAVFRIDIGQAHDKKNFLEEIARALQFPSWFGKNWDALTDCLTDLDWLSTTTGYVLVFENSDRFCSSSNQNFETAKSVLSAAAEYWKVEERPFWVLFEISAKSQCDLPKWPI